MTAREAYVAFNLADRIGSVGVGELAEKFGGVEKAWAAHGGEVDWQREFELAKRFGVAILTPADAEYPAILRNTRGHPLVLYVKGNVKALSMPSVAIVGTRRATAYGTDQANRFAHDLAMDGWSIVSGLALGIDAEAHRGALDAGGVTVGVLGSALDQFYPEQNRELAREIVRKGGAVISEFSFGRQPDTQTFPQRNHVVAALAQGVLAVEAPIKSGTLITTSIAADLGRAVMALPGRVDSRSSAGCLTLIREGATLVRCPADVTEALSQLLPNEMKLSPLTDDGGKTDEKAAKCDKTAELPQVSLEEAMVLKHLTVEGTSVDRLVSLTGLGAGKVNSVVLSLRLKGRIRCLAGNRVALPRGS